MKSNVMIKPLSVLAEIQTGPFGSQLHKEDYVDIGTPIVTVEHLGNKRFSEQNLPYVSDKDKERLRKYILREGDIVFSRVGSVDRCSYVSDEYEGWMFSGRCLRVRPSAEIVPEYLYYYFTLETTKQFVRGIATGATMPSINTKFMGEVPVSYPSIDNQRKIADILGTIDEKIEVNNAINENLLQQAEALFEERFLTSDTIPIDWKRMALGDVSDMSAGGDKPQNISDKKTDNYRYPIYSNGISDEGLYGFTSDYRISDESVTVSARGTIGFVCLRHVPFTPIVRLVTLVPHKDIVSAKYLYLWLKSIPIHGTGTTQQQLTVPDFRKTEIIIPPKADMQDFTETVDPLFSQVWSNQEENAKLADVRDALLPRLMSGELDVSSIDI